MAKTARSKSSRDAYGAEGEQKILLITPDKLVLVEDKNHPLYDDRVHLPVDEALVLNIMAVGVLENVIIWKDPETADILVVDGRQRVKATIEANKRLKKAKREIVLVPCTPRRGNTTDLFGVSVSTFIRQDDSPLGRATKMQRYIDMGRSNDQVAVTFGCTVATVKNTLSLLEAPVAVRKAVESGKIAASTAYQLAREKDPEVQKKRLGKILEIAPRIPGKKHSKGGSKARKIAAGNRRKKKLKVTGEPTVLVGLRTMEQIKKMDELISESSASGEDKRIIDCVFQWIYGDEHAFDEWLSKNGDEASPDSGELAAEQA
jgi:ParB family chromosome partitioning protein